MGWIDVMTMPCRTRSGPGPIGLCGVRSGPERRDGGLFTLMPRVMCHPLWLLPGVADQPGLRILRQVDVAVGQACGVLDVSRGRFRSNGIAAWSRDSHAASWAWSRRVSIAARNPR